MSLDPYKPCPCGSGKKLKFCCSDIGTDIEKIQRMINGDQTQAAMRHVEQCLRKHPHKASLLDIGICIHLSNGEFTEAAEKIDLLLKHHSDSPTTHADHAILLASQNKPDEATLALQNAIEREDEALTNRTIEAFGVVGSALLMSGRFLAAQLHLRMSARLSPTDDDRAEQLLSRLYSQGGLPAILRDIPQPKPAPDDAPWKEDVEQANQFAIDLRLNEAIAIIDRLGNEYGAHPVLVYNRSIASGYIGDHRALIAGLKAYSQLEVPFDEAVEAEAIAQLLDPTLSDPTVPIVTRSYEIKDLARLEELVLDSPYVEPHDVEPQQSQSGPPPSGQFLLYDKSAPKSGIDITRDQVPLVIANMAIFGRQTDRQERLEMTVDKGRNFQPAENALRELAGDTIGELLEEKEEGRISEIELALSWQWSFPPDTPIERRRQISNEVRASAIVERWPQVARPALQGKTPAEAAGDPSLLIPLAAAVFQLEHSLQNIRQTEAIRTLRDNLGVPTPQPVAATTDIGYTLPLVRIGYLDLTEVTSADLERLLWRSMTTRSFANSGIVARELVSRPVTEEIGHDTYRLAYDQLYSTAETPDEAIEWTGKGEAYAREHGLDVAVWEIARLEVYLAAGRGEEVVKLVEHLQETYQNDERVTTKVFSLMYEYGLVSDEDLAPQQAALQAQAAAQSPQPQSPSESQIWTPDSQQPPEKKQAIWTPS